MKELIGKEIILHVSGTVQNTNLSEFEASANAVISSINMVLETDQDFAEAKENIKACKEVEIRIGNAKNQAINSIAEVAEQNRILERLEAKFREIRLTLNRTVQSEETRRKNEIISGGFDEVKAALAASNVSHGYRVDKSDFTEAIKGKRSLEKMQEAIEELVVGKKREISALNSIFLANIESIKKAEVDFPGLFPDKNTLSLQSIEMVDVNIESRVNQYKLKQQEREQREREERDLKDRLERERAEALETERMVAEELKNSEPAKIEEKKDELLPPEINETTFSPPKEPEVEQSEIRAIFAGTRQQATTLALGLFRDARVKRIFVNGVEIV